MQKRWMSALVIALIACLIPAGSALADVTFSDPTGDDHGPGEYVYPTDAVYTRGSFDLTELKVETKGKRAVFEVSVNSNVEDPWGMDTGFSIQMVFIFIDTDGEEGSGHTDSPPGLNVTFGPGDAWDKVVILSPQPFARVKQEVEAKAAGMAADVVIPSRVSGGGRSISGQVKLAEISEGDPATWGYQVVMQSNEGFPAEGDLLTRKVNEFEGQHRFGGGSDYDCDPHAIDVLGGADQLKYKCAADGTAEEMAVLKMMRQESK